MQQPHYELVDLIYYVHAFTNTKHDPILQWLIRRYIQSHVVKYHSKLQWTMVSSMQYCSVLAKPALHVTNISVDET